MDARKEAKVEDFVEYLEGHGIEYRKKANGHFHILIDGVLRYQVWATTEKMIPQDGPQVIGMASIHKELESQSTNRG